MNARICVLAVEVLGTKDAFGTTNSAHINMDSFVSVR
jgi:hypothetical protein